MNQAQLIQGLNQGLSGELGTIIRYTVQSSKALGPHDAEVRELLRNEIQDKIGHATFLADVIVDLGGEPTPEPKSFDSSDSLRDMLQLDINMEQNDVTNYTERAALVEKSDKTELKVRLEEMAADEARHARELRRLITGI